MRNPEVERAQHDRPLEVKRPVGAEVLPEPERDLGKLEPAAAAAAVADLVVPLRCGDVGHGTSLPPLRGSAPFRAGAEPRPIAVVLEDADLEDKPARYKGLNLQLTCQHATRSHLRQREIRFPAFSSDRDDRRRNWRILGRAGRYEVSLCRWPKEFTHAASVVATVTVWSPKLATRSTRPAVTPIACASWVWVSPRRLRSSASRKPLWRPISSRRRRSASSGPPTRSM